jgi:hypothetical protein
MVRVNYRPVLSSEKAPHTKRTAISEGNFCEKEIKIGLGSQMVA